MPWDELTQLAKLQCEKWETYFICLYLLDINMFISIKYNQLISMRKIFYYTFTI